MSTRTREVRWLLADDHNSRVYTVHAIDSEDPLLAHVGEPAKLAGDALDRVVEDPPDVLLIDLKIPKTAGDKASEESGVWLAEEVAKLKRGTRMVIYSNDHIRAADPLHRDWVDRLDRAGVLGWMTRAEDFDVIASRILLAAEGNPAFCGDGIYDAWRACLRSPHPCLAEPEPMTKLQHRLMVLMVAFGLTQSELAQREKLPLGTIEHQLREAAEKVGLSAPWHRLGPWAARNCPDVVRLQRADPADATDPIFH